MELSQQTKLTQTTTLSAKQQQSLKLLAMNSLALGDAIEQELESNPTLDTTLEGSGDRVQENEESDNLTSERADSLESFVWAASSDNAPRYSRFSDAPDGDAFFDNQAAPGEGLSEHLIRQLEVTCEDEATFEIASEIATSLDADGYLRLSVGFLARELDVAAERVEDVLIGCLQGLDPPGVGARDLRECLLIQWRASDDKPPLVAEIIEKHLGTIGKIPSEQLAGRLGVSQDELNEALAIIRSYEPIPGRAYDLTSAQPLIPDVEVYQVEGEIRVNIIEESIPRLRLSGYYTRMLEDAANLDAKTKRYLIERIRAAAWFIRAVHQRRKTMEKVTGSIFERQSNFLADGTGGLKPLTMDEVADEIDMHVSTVSRAVADKIVNTPYGLFPLKYFFTGALKGDGGEVATEKVKSLIYDIVSAENSERPFSDEEIAGELEERGIKIARRTVAKYRKQLNIPPKHERKKYL